MVCKADFVPLHYKRVAIGIQGGGVKLMTAVWTECRCFVQTL